jgi:DNA replication and repair protein RecF
VVVTRLRLRDFRSYADAEVGLGERLTVVHGPNGAGKTNLLEALYFGCTGRSCRTTNERELVRFDENDSPPARVVRVEVHGRDRDGEHELSVGFQPGEAKRFKVDGAPAERLLDAPHRPLVSVFLPDRLELVKGPPALRRSHLDQVVGALWPARAATRRQYAQVLAQRNALLARVRGGGSRSALAAWDLELARHGIALRDDRAAAL